MLEIRLDAHVVNGKLEISSEQQKELTVIKSGSPVEVIVRTDQPVSQQKIVQRDILQEMIERGYNCCHTFCVVDSFIVAYFLLLFETYKLITGISLALAFVMTTIRNCNDTLHFICQVSALIFEQASTCMDQTPKS
jgi:hypothetical protein